MKARKLHTSLTINFSDTRQQKVYTSSYAVTHINIQHSTR